MEVENLGEMNLGEGVKYLTKIDLVVENVEQGGVYVVDHKTTGKTFDFRYWSQYEPNSQITGYCAYAEAKYGSCSGCYINGIRLGFRERKYKDEPAGFYHEFQRQLFNRNHRQVEKWKDNVLHWTDKLREAEAKDIWPKNEGACMFCSFRPICTAEWDPRDEGDRECIECQYEKVNPLAYLEGR